MVYIKSNIDNSDYLVIEPKDMIGYFIENKCVPSYIKGIVYNIYSKLFEFEKKFDTGYVSEVSIRKDSKLGEFLLHTKDIDIINDDEYVSYDKVVNAMNISMYEEDSICTRIMPLFKDEIFGMRSELEGRYDKEVLDYILNHTDFFRFLQLKNGDYSEPEYVVYEDDKYCVCALGNSRIDSKKKARLIDSHSDN